MDSMEVDNSEYERAREKMWEAEPIWRQHMKEASDEADRLFLEKLKKEEEANNPKPSEEEETKDGIVVHSIPDTVKDVNKYFMSMKVPLEPYRIFCTLNQANRTITLTKDLDRTPVPELLIKDGVKSFTESFDKERASKLQKAWPMVEAAFEDRGILSTLDMAHFSMTVSTTTTTQHPDTIFKAWYLLKLLHASHVPTSLAIETFSGSRYYDIFMVEDLCSKFNIRKEEYLKWLPRSLNSLQALSEKHHCHLFLNKDTITAVAAGEASSTGFYGLSPGADLNKYIVEDICHATFSKDDLDDMMEEACPSLNEGRMVAASCLYSSVNEKRATYLQESWLFVDSSLKEHDISSTLNVAKPSITLSTTRTKEPYIMDDAWRLLELLSTTHVPVCLAIEIMNGSMQHDFIKIGLQKGGLCSIHGIKKKDYLERWNCLRWSLQALSELVGCDLFLNENTVTSVESSSGVSRLVRTIVEACIVSNECPAVSVRNFNIFYKTFQPTENAEDPHGAHGVPVKMKYGHRAEITCFCRIYDEDEEIDCKEHWQMLEPCLKKYDFSCTLNQPMYGVSYLGRTLSSITVSRAKSIGESGIVDKAWNLLELLTVVQVDAPMAMEILEGTQRCLFINTGFKGGLCSKFGIEKGQHFELLARLRYILEKVADIAGCHFYSMDEDFFAVVSGDPEVLMLFKTHAREWLEDHKDDYKD